MEYEDQLIYKPVDELTEPKDGRVLVDRYWLVDPLFGAAFHEGLNGHLAPQCNDERQIVDHINKKLHPDRGLEVQYIPVAFLGQLGE